MACEYVRRFYGVPAEIGRRIEFRGRGGVIAEDRGHYIGVLFDDRPAGTVDNVHPTDGVTYLDMGPVRQPQLTRSQKRYRRYLELQDCYDSFAQFLAFHEEAR